MNKAILATLLSLVVSTPALADHKEPHVTNFIVISQCDVPKGVIIVQSDGTFRAIQLTPDSLAYIQATELKVPKDHRYQVDVSDPTQCSRT